MTVLLATVDIVVKCSGFSIGSPSAFSIEISIHSQFFSFCLFLFRSFFLFYSPIFHLVVHYHSNMVRIVYEHIERKKCVREGERKRKRIGSVKSI